MNIKNESIGINYFRARQTVKLWQSNCVRICALFSVLRRANAMKSDISLPHCVLKLVAIPLHSHFGHKPPANIVVEMNVANPLVWRKSFDKKLSQATLNTQHK